MGTRNLHRIAGALERMKHEAATGPCFLSTCPAPAVGYIMGTSGQPCGVCAEHKPDAEARGFTVWPDPKVELETSGTVSGICRPAPWHAALGPRDPDALPY